MIPLDKKFTVIDDGGLGVWGAGDDYDPVPPRKWLLGNTFCRTFLSSLISTGGVGKTALRIAQALSLATGRELTEEHVFRRARVLYVSLEDDRDELRRRIKAAMLHYGTKHADVKGWLFLSSITGSGWKLNSDSGWKLSSLEYRDGQAAGQLTHRLKREIETLKIDLVILDPFIKAHCAEENDNTAIDRVAAIAAKIAIDHDCAIDVPHHTSKMFAEPGNANAGRGASSFKDAGRLTYTLTPMSMDEAKQFNLSEEERRSLVRVDSAKVNLVRASTSAAWFRLASVNLGNGTEEYPAGDNIQVAEPWVPPDMWRDLSPSLCCRIIDELEAGLENGDRYSSSARATTSAAWPIVIKHAEGLNKEQARAVISKWLKTGVLEERPYYSEAQRKDRVGLYANTANRPGSNAP